MKIPINKSSETITISHYKAGFKGIPAKLTYNFKSGASPVGTIQFVGLSPDSEKNAFVTFYDTSEENPNISATPNAEQVEYFARKLIYDRGNR